MPSKREIGRGKQSTKTYFYTTGFFTNHFSHVIAVAENVGQRPERKKCTIGTTMTITDKAVPNIVGVDIGCGMYTVIVKPGSSK